MSEHLEERGAERTMEEDMKVIADHIVSLYELEIVISPGGHVSLWSEPLQTMLLDSDDGGMPTLEEITKSILGGPIDTLRADVASWRKTLAEQIAIIDAFVAGADFAGEK